jgi:predicted NAD-dependent protein-ADP-ribosyltransferase YbiA (DUF1768 family)
MFYFYLLGIFFILSDTIWGIGYGEKNEKSVNPKLWRGSNYLGFCLMEVRERLKEKKEKGY